jgi:hypothetical protein
MKNHPIIIVAFALISAIILIFGCSKEKAPLGPFQPEIANIQDDFQFQATALQNVSASVIYEWQNSGIAANVDQSCSITSGEAWLTVLDNDGITVYSSDLQENGSFSSSEGITGIWTIKVDIYNVYGTMNFRVQAP